MSNRVESLLKDTEVEVSNLGLLFREKGVIVTLSFKGGQRTYSISPKAFGVKRENLSEESQEFLDKHVKNGSVTFISKDEWKKLQTIKSKTRKKLDELSIGEVLGNSYLTTESFLEFEKYFNASRKEYLEVRDSLVQKYDDMVLRFKEIIENSISDMEAHAAKTEYERIMNKLPTKEEFKESFIAEMHCFGIPTLSDLDEVDERIRLRLTNQYKEIGESLVGDATISIINEGIKALSSVVRSGAINGRIHPKVLDGVKNSTNRMKQNNIFSNPRLDEARLEMEKILTIDVDSAIELAERLLAELYNHSVELGLEEKADLKDCPFDGEELKSLYQMYN